jgi:tRNA dimethylallyltransferase
MLPQNWKRIIRALEVFYLTEKSITGYYRTGKRSEDFEFIQFGLQLDRSELYKNINDRVDNMIAEGLIDEVSSILAKGYDKKLNAFNTVGYKEIISYLEEEVSLDEAIDLIKRNTRHFAKRQMTWFKKDTRIKWFNIHEFTQLDKIAGEILRILK